MFVRVQVPNNPMASDDLLNINHAMNIVLLENDKSIVAMVGELFMLSVMTTPPGSIKPSMPNTMLLGKYKTVEECIEKYNGLVEAIQKNLNFYDMRTEEDIKEAEEKKKEKENKKNSATASGILLS